MVSVVVNLRDIDRIQLLRKLRLDVDARAIGELRPVGEVAGGVEPERPVLDEQAEAHAVLAEPPCAVKTGVEVAHASIAAENPPVAGDVDDRERRICRGVSAHRHLVDCTDLELLHLESVALDEEVIDLAHVDIAIRVAEFVGNRVVEVRPAAVEGRIEPQRVCRL